MTPKILAGIGADDSDVIKTVNALRNAGIASLGEITAAEDRARQILAKRQNHHEAVADKLFELECLEGEVLDQALGKMPLQSADAGN